jgi:hypothetical protein
VAPPAAARPRRSASRRAALQQARSSAAQQRCGVSQSRQRVKVRQQHGEMTTVRRAVPRRRRGRPRSPLPAAWRLCSHAKRSGATRGRSAGRVPPATGAPPHSPTAAPPFLSPRARRLCTEHVSVCASLRAPRLDGAPLRRALPRHATHTAAHHAPPPAPPHAARAPLPRRQQRLPASIVILINALAAPRLATSAHA